MCKKGRSAINMRLLDRKSFIAVLLSFALVLLFIADIMTGSAGISAGDVLKAVAGGDVPPMTRTIILEIRLVRAAVAVLAGMSVSVCGLLMQTFFRNPLAGPYVLGVNSGACLGAALFVLGLPSVVSNMAPEGTGIGLAQLGLAGAAWAGAAAVMLLVAWFSRRTRNIMVVLVLGIMLGSGIDALVQILQYFSSGETLKSYVLWTMGSLGSVTPGQLPLLGLASFAGLSVTAYIVKPLNLLLMGEEYAVSMGINIHRTRVCIYMIIILMAGTVTAFCGPIGFIGLAVPHVARWLTGSADHRAVLPAAALAGAALMLVCDIAASSLALPLNVLTSILGVPIVFCVVLRSKISM